MSCLERIFGRFISSSALYGPRGPFAARANLSEDDRARLGRYRYLVANAPAQELEQAHTEAFSALSPESRRAVQAQMGRIPLSQRPKSDSPEELARVAVQNEAKRPGYMERAFGVMGASPSGASARGLMDGGSFATSMIGSIVGSALASTVAGRFFAEPPNAQGFDQFLRDGGADRPYGMPVAEPEFKAFGDSPETDSDDQFGSAADSDWASADPLGDPADFDDSGSDLDLDFDSD